MTCFYINYSWHSYFKSIKCLSDSFIILNLFQAPKSIWHMPLLPDDIIRLEILTRLPVKSLVRFQCVCKLWQSFISTGDPAFIKSHLAYTCTDPNDKCLIGRCNIRRDTPKTEPNHPLLSPTIRLVGSVNGLVCVYGYYYAPATNSITCIGIWNPVTNRYKDIPPPTYTIGSLAYSLGFGFDPIAGDYKVICFTRIHNQPLVAHVYSCNAGCWNDIKVTSNVILNGLLCTELTIVGARLYWINYENRPGEHSVISFDVTQELFRLLPDLGFVWSSGQYVGLTNLRDSFAVIAYEYTGTTSVDVYVLDETISGCGGWSKKYTVGPITLTTKMVFFECFWNGDLLFKDGEEFKLVCIDSETHKIKSVCNYSYDTSCFGRFDPYKFAYTQTLASVKGMQPLQLNLDASNIIIIER